MKKTFMRLKVLALLCTMALGAWAQTDISTGIRTMQDDVPGYTIRVV